jgi:gluconate 2-dehydrogenase alpha chain
VARQKPVDVVFIGAGLTMSIMANELTDAGLNVLALERGAWQDTSTDWSTAYDQDELRYMWRHALFEDLSRSTLTFRNDPSQTALPMRKLGSFLPGTGVGGSAIHWNGQIWRSLPADFRMRSHNLERYGASAIAEDMTIQDWPVSYEELEPYYDKFEYVFGISGKAGNLQGQIQPGGNPFEGPRRREFPNPPMTMSYAPTLFGKAAAELGHHPFPAPSANMSQAYTNPLGVKMGPCTYCGYCEKFACGNYSKAVPQTTILPALMSKANFTLKTGCEVLKINLDSERRRATGVTYVDASGQEVFQPAEIVVLSAFILNNVRLLLLSGIGQPYDIRTGQGVIGKNYAYQIMSEVDVFFEDKLTNPFLGAGALGVAVDDFNGDNFDHSGKGFIGGGYICLWTTGARPIETHPTPPGTPKWGAEWKKSVAHWYSRAASIQCHGGVTSRRTNFLDLDPTYKDALGRPLLRMTFDFPENDKRMSAFLTDRAAEIARAMGATHVHPKGPQIPYSIVPYQTTHNTGGAIMGDDPRTSAVNRYLQSWDISNLFVTGATTFPQNPGYNPSGTLSALAYWCADAIRSQYVKSPGPLVRA